MGTFSGTSVMNAAGPSEPCPAEASPLARLVEVMRAIQAQLPPLAPPESASSTVTRWPNPETIAYIGELEAKGVDGDKLVRMLAGLDPRQRLNLVLLVNSIDRMRLEQASAKVWRHKLGQILKSYAKWERFAPDSGVFRPETLTALRQDIGTLRVAIRLLTPPRQDRPVPRRGITFTPAADVFRQGFWTEPMAALVEYLLPFLGSYERAYQATARVLTLAFQRQCNEKALRTRVIRHRRHRR